MPPALPARVDEVLAAFAEAHGRFTARLEGASAQEAATGPDGGWTPAQIGAHVAAFDMVLARIVNGAAPGAAPAPPGFVERGWPEIEATLKGRLDAPALLQPAADVDRGTALAALAQAADAVIAALRGLDHERATMTFTHPRVGTVSLAQIGDLIVAHTIRHNAQLKRALGR
jgi:hypothetical protein